MFILHILISKQSQVVLGCNFGITHFRLALQSLAHVAEIHKVGQRHWEDTEAECCQRGEPEDKRRGGPRGLNATTEGSLRPCDTPTPPENAARIA